MNTMHRAAASGWDKGPQFRGLVLTAAVLDALILVLASIAFVFPRPAATPEALPVDIVAADEPVIAISMRADSVLFINSTRTTFEDLTRDLDVILKSDKKKRIYFRADTKVNYGDVARVLERLSRGGYANVKLVVDSSR